MLAGKTTAMSAAVIATGLTLVFPPTAGALTMKENGNGGLKWIQKGGGYYSECNKQLKG